MTATAQWIRRIEQTFASAGRRQSWRNVEAAVRALLRRRAGVQFPALDLLLPSEGIPDTSPTDGARTGIVILLARGRPTNPARDYQAHCVKTSFAWYNCRQHALDADDADLARDVVGRDLGRRRWCAIKEKHPQDELAKIKAEMANRDAYEK